jgi:DNA-binding CsgD family transcriptional regulator
MILSKNDVIRVRGGQLTASASDVNKRLQQIISACAMTDGGHGGSMRVPRIPPARPLALSMSSIRPTNRGAFFLGTRPAAVTVFVSDPDQVPTPPTSLLRELYGLTKQEANLALHLLQGHDLREAGDLMGVSFTTARTYLSQLFQKTDTHRQAELVRLLSSGLMCTQE